MFFARSLQRVEFIKSLLSLKFSYINVFCVFLNVSRHFTYDFSLSLGNLLQFANRFILPATFIRNILHLQ